jgi:hypothetical protein
MHTLAMPDEPKRPSEPAPPEPKKPETDPVNPNRAPEPKRQDDGQQTA